MSVQQLSLDGIAPPRPATRRPYDYEWERVRQLVLERDAWTCHWCGGPATTGDHLVALVDGGARLDPDNVVAACQPCNSRRGAEVSNRRRSLGPLSREW